MCSSCFRLWHLPSKVFASVWMIWMVELYKDDGEEAFSASLAISLDMSAHFLLSLVAHNRRKATERQWKRVIVFICSTVWKTYRCSSDTSYSKELGKPKFTTDAALTCAACFFFSVQHAKVQFLPVVFKIRNTRDIVSFVLVINCIFFFLLHCWHQDLYLLKEYKMVVGLEFACSLMAYILLQSSVFLPQNMHKSLQIVPKCEWVWPCDPK